MIGWKADETRIPDFEASAEPGQDFYLLPQDFYLLKSPLGERVGSRDAVEHLS